MFITGVSDKLPELDSISSKILSAETDIDNGIKAFGEVQYDTDYSIYVACKRINTGLSRIRGMFEMNCLLSSSSISTWGTIKTNTYLYRAIQYLHNGV